MFLHITTLNEKARIPSRRCERTLATVKRNARLISYDCLTRYIDNIKRDTNPEIFECATDKKPTTLLKGFLYFFIYFSLFLTIFNRAVP